jgi:competence ComEA-like helix-hairpin-helix protein
MKKLLKRKRFFNILTLISLTGFLVFPNICLGINLENITYPSAANRGEEEIYLFALENINKHLSVPEKEAGILIHSLINLFHSEWLELMMDPISSPRETAVSIIMKKVVQTEVLNHLLVDAPIKTVFNIVQNTVKAGRIFLTQDYSVILDQLEKQSVEAAVKYGINILFENEIRISPGAMEFKYISKDNNQESALFQYVIIYQPVNSREGEILIRFYSVDSLKLPKNDMSYGSSWGIYTELTSDLPPFLVDIRGNTQDYKWVDEPLIEVDFSSEVPDLGIRPLGFWERLALKPFENMIKDVEVIITKVTGKSLGLVKAWQGIKLFVSGITDFSLAALFSSQDKAEEEIFAGSELSEEEPEKRPESEPESKPEPEPEPKPESRKELESESEKTIGQDLETENSQEKAKELQKALDEIARQINLLNQEFVKLEEGQKQEVIEKTDDFEEEVIFEEEVLGWACVNINTASLKELIQIIHIGAIRAEQIIQLRRERLFSSVEDLIRVSGIGEITLAAILAQELACVGPEAPLPVSASDTASTTAATSVQSSSSQSSQLQPQLNLSYLENNPVNKDIKVTFSAVNLKNNTYDLKISILAILEESEQKRTLSEIYSSGNWQSSYNYLRKVFSGVSFSGDFKLKIKDEHKNYLGQADIIVKIRDSNGKIVSEFKDKINIVNPEQEIPVLEADEEEEGEENEDEEDEEEEEADEEEEEEDEGEDGEEDEDEDEEEEDEDEDEEDEEKDEVTDIEEDTTELPYSKILVSEIQIEGGNINHDFIELYNPGDSGIDISGYKLRKRTSGGTESSIRVLPSGSVIPAKGYYLWVSSKDEDYPSSINADTSTTQILASNNSIALLTPENVIINALAWGGGTTSFVEISPFPDNPGKNQSLGRIWNKEAGEYKNTGNNSADFEFQPPTPKKQNRSFFPAQLEISLDVLEFSINSTPKYLSITNSGEESLAWQALIQYVTPSVDGWLDIFPHSGQLSADETKSIEVSQHLVGFPEGEYQAEIIVDAGQIKGSPKNIEVLLKAADDIPPIVSFNQLPSVQKELIFDISWQGEDVSASVEDGTSFVSPSGIDGFLLFYTSTPVLDGIVAGQNGLQYFDFNLNQWKLWLEDKILFVRDTFLRLLGKDRQTYSFSIKAEDKAGNQSEGWTESNLIEINIPKPVLKVEDLKLEFEGIEFGSNPPSKTFSIFNIGDAPLEWEIEVCPEVDWLNLSSFSGQNNKDISVSVDVSNLSSGSYEVDFFIASNGGSEQVRVILELEEDKIPPANADLTLIDLDSGLNSYAGNKMVKAVIANDQDALFWFLSESQIRPEIDDLNWQDAKPSTFILSEGDGLKTVYVWTKDKAGNISQLGNAAFIILDTTPPIAVAGENRIVEINQSIVFDASGSSDNTEIVSFKWDIDIRDGLNWDEPDLADEVSVFVGYSKIGNYKVTLQVSDAAGHVSEDTFLVEVVLPQEPTLEVVINEIAWMGTNYSANHEWIELYNPNREPVEITNWQLLFYPLTGAEPRVNEFSVVDAVIPVIDGYSYFLLERTSDNVISDVEADYIFIGALNDDGGILELRDNNDNLIDRVDASDDWFADDREKRISMERIDQAESGSDPKNWADNNLAAINGRDNGNNLIYGTPKQENSVSKLETHISSLPFSEELSEITLTFLGNPYIMERSFKVPSGKTLIIEPGTVIKFKDHNSGMLVGGTLKAIGEKDKKIVFTSYQDEEYGGSGAYAGSWNQIYFAPGSSHSELDNVVIRYGGAYPSEYCKQKAAAILVEDSSIVLKNAIIENNAQRGVFLVDSSSTIIDNVYFNDHQTGCYRAKRDSIISLHISGGEPIIENSFFENNIIGIEVAAEAVPEIRDNIFENNGKPIYALSTSPIFSGNQAVNNNLDGIFFYGSINKNSVWSASLSYIVNYTLIIPDGVTLALEPGVVVRFYRGDGGMSINGILKAVGNETEQVVFTSYYDKDYGGIGIGSWRSLHFYSSGSVLDNIIIRRGGTDYEGDYKVKSGAITLNNKDIEITVKDSIIEKNRYGTIVYKNYDCQPIEEIIEIFRSENTVFRENDFDFWPACQ